jgi:hypothetical protein
VDFVAVVDQAITLLRQRGRLTYRTLQRQFQLDDAALEDLKDELIYGQRLMVRCFRLKWSSRSLPRPMGYRCLWRS